MTVTHRWTIADLEDLQIVEEERYEIIGGELYMSKQPHPDHQQVCSELTSLVVVWSKTTGSALKEHYNELRTLEAAEMR